MANMTVGVFVLLTLFSLSMAMHQITSGDPEYDGLCPESNTTTLILTRNTCDLRTYIICFRGSPLYTQQCSDLTPRFNKITGYCDYKENVPGPDKRCKPESDDMKPTSCKMGAITLPKESTCKEYISCAGNQELTMPCNRFSYFIEGRCRFDQHPFTAEINQAELQRCKELDIWTEEEEEGTPY